MTFMNNDYREIITKAVCGTGREATTTTHTIAPMNKPSSILGCWVINHRYRAKLVDEDRVEVRGTYDINIWYSYNDNTKTEVVSKTVEYCDEISLSEKDDHCMTEDADVIAKVIQQPNCLDCKISKKDNKIKVDVEKEFVVQVIGETKVFVRVSQMHEKKEREDVGRAFDRQRPPMSEKFSDDHRR